MSEVSTAIGLLGASLYLVAYGGLQIGWLRSDQALYSWLNLLAATCVLIDLQRHFNLPAALIQVSWIAISLFGLARICSRSRRPRAMLSSIDPRLMRSYSYLDSVRECATGRSDIAHRI
ncbi:MAG: hypothetical protein AAGA32_12670 [Pseudomonadota bacterium]